MDEALLWREQMLEADLRTQRRCCEFGDGRQGSAS